MFLDKFDSHGVVHGPVGQGRGAFVSREDAARTAAAVLANQPGGIHDVTGPEALSVAEIAARLSALVGRDLRYEDESVDAVRERVSRQGLSPWQVDLQAGWFEAIAAGELDRTADTVLRFAGAPPLTLETYFNTFPDLLSPLRNAHA